MFDLIYLISPFSTIFQTIHILCLKILLQLIFFRDKCEVDIPIEQKLLLHDEVRVRLPLDRRRCGHSIPASDELFVANCRSRDCLEERIYPFFVRRNNFVSLFFQRRGRRCRNLSQIVCPKPIFSARYRRTTKVGQKSERYRCDHVFLSFTQLRTTKADILSERYRSRSSTPDFRSPCSISYRCNAILYTVSIFLTHSFPVANSIDVSTSSFFNISV